MKRVEPICRGERVTSTHSFQIVHANLLLAIYGPAPSICDFLRHRHEFPTHPRVFRTHPWRSAPTHPRLPPSQADATDAGVLNAGRGAWALRWPVAVVRGIDDWLSFRWMRAMISTQASYKAFREPPPKASRYVRRFRSSGYAETREIRTLQTLKPRTMLSASPVAMISGPTQIQAGQQATFSATGSHDPDPGAGSMLSFSWDLDGDGNFWDAYGEQVTFDTASFGTLQYGSPRNVGVRVSDGQDPDSVAYILGAIQFDTTRDNDADAEIITSLGVTSQGSGGSFL